MAQSPEKAVVSSQAPAGGATGDEQDTPRKSASLKKMGSALKKAFTPRKSSSVEDIAEPVDRMPSDEGESKKKKKSGIKEALRTLGSKVKTPRSHGAPTESSTDASIEVEREVEEKPSNVQAIAEEVLTESPDHTKEAKKQAYDPVKEVSGSVEETKQQVAQAVAPVVKKTEDVIPDVPTATSDSVISKITPAVSSEVEATKANVHGDWQKRGVATRDIQLPTAPAVEKKVEKVAEQPGSKKEPQKRGRGFVISGLCIGIIVIAVKLATNGWTSEDCGVVDELMAPQPDGSVLYGI